MCYPQELLCTHCIPELSLAVWTAAVGVEAPMELGVFMVVDAFFPPPVSSTVRTTREVLNKLVAGDSVPIDLLSQFEAAVRPGAPRKEDPQLRELWDQHLGTCETL